MSLDNYTPSEEDEKELSPNDAQRNDRENSSLLDKLGLNGEIENRQDLEIGVNNVFVKYPFYKKGFENFCECSTDEDKKSALEELKQCKTEQEFIDFVRHHQIKKLTKVQNESNLEQKHDEKTKETELKAGEKELEKTETESVARKTESEATKVELRMEDSKAKAEEDKAKVEEENNDIDSIYMMLNEGLELRKNILKDYPKLDKKTSDRAKQLNEELPETTRNQLKEKGYDDNFIYNYILLKVTLNEVKNDSRFDAGAVKIFKDKVNNLSTMDIFLKNIDNACKIADTDLDSFSSENIANTRRELFDEAVGNKDLQTKRKEDIKNHNYEELFEETIDEKNLIEKYGNLIEGESKDFLYKYQNDPNFKKLIDGAKDNAKDNPNATNQEKQLKYLYDKMITELKDKKRDVEDETKSLIEDMCVITQVNGMIKCIGQENGNFTFNKAKEIEIENDNIIIKGHINGVDFSLRQNTKQEWSPLQVSSNLVKSADGRSFEIGNNEKQKFESSPYALPGQMSIFNMIKDIVSPSVKSTEKIETIDTYIENLQSNITGKVDEIYNDTNEAHDYMNNKIKGEDVIKNGIDLVKNADLNMDFSKPIDSNSTIYPFIKILNFNIERSDPSEKDKLNDCIKKILEITKDYEKNAGDEEAGAHEYPEIINKFLKDPAWLSKGNTDARLSCLSELFKYYSKEASDASRFSPQGSDSFPTRIIINDLHRDLFGTEDERSTVAKTYAAIDTIDADERPRGEIEYGGPA